jgi:hypothetical protein
MPNIDDVLARTRPARRSVDICLDGSLRGRLEDLQARWRAAVDYDREHNEPDTAPAIAAQIAALRDEVDAATVTFTVEAIGAAPWRRLVAEHPPPTDDLEGWRWNLETFPPAAVAASCIDPKMSEDQAAELAERLSDAQWGKLFGAVLSVNVADDIPLFAAGIDAPPTSEQNSTTAAPEESLTASSSGSGDSPLPAS